jgi:hypothetical protein
MNFRYHLNKISSNAFDDISTIIGDQLESHSHSAVPNGAFAFGIGAITLTSASQLTIINIIT